MGAHGLKFGVGVTVGNGGAVDVMVSEGDGDGAIDSLGSIIRVSFSAELQDERAIKIKSQIDPLFE